jgi:hypothetical protein
MSVIPINIRNKKDFFKKTWREPKIIYIFALSRKIDSNMRHTFLNIQSPKGMGSERDQIHCGEAYCTTE